MIHHPILDRVVRIGRRAWRDRSLPPHLIEHIRWTTVGRHQSATPPRSAAVPVRDEVLQATVMLLQAAERAKVLLFLIADEAPATTLGLADEQRSAFTNLVGSELPEWSISKSTDSITLRPRISGAGGAHICITFWQKNNLGEREQVGRRGLHRLFADDEFGHHDLHGVEVLTTPSYVPPSQQLRADFPVDAVISWVNADDQAWRTRFERAKHEVSPERSAVEPARFRSRDELRYLLRSLESFAPFFRHVFVVTDCAAPRWLAADTADITIVDQTELLGGAPVFNSLAVETALHRIDGLAEHYVYFNDDMFLARPIDRDLFFSPGGRLRLTQGPRIRAGAPRDGENAFETGAKQARALVASTFGWTPEFSANHVPLPQRRSIGAAMEHHFGQALKETRTSTFRHQSNTTSATGLLHYVAAHEDLVASSPMTWDYVDTGAKVATSRYAAIERSISVDTFCLNDEGGAGNPAQLDALHAFLERYFPTPSRFEVTP